MKHNLSLNKLLEVQIIKVCALTKTEFNYKFLKERSLEHAQIFENKNDVFLNNPWVKETKREIRKYFKLNEKHILSECVKHRKCSN